MNIDFSNPTKHFGNDVASLIETYTSELLKMSPDSRGKLSEIQIKSFFIAYVFSRSSVVFASFKDRQIGIKLWRMFMEELSEVSSSTGDLDALGRLTEVFRKELNANPKSFNDYVMDIYIGVSKNTATKEELIWVKNFIRAIHNIDKKYNEAAEKFGFL
jgi:hypothetical protein